MQKLNNTLVVGAGVAGLASSLFLVSKQQNITLVERERAFGGLSKTIEIDGFKFEIGPHLYLDRDEKTLEFWRSLSGVQLIKIKRRSAIFINGRYIDSPLRPINALINLGIRNVFKILRSFMRVKIRKRLIHNSEEWVVAKYGQVLHDLFFRSFNLKIWGMPGSEIDKMWAQQRIQVDLVRYICAAILGKNKTLNKSFYLPKNASDSVINSQISTLRESKLAEIRTGVIPTSIQKLQYGFTVDFSDGTSEQFQDVIFTGFLDDLSKIIKSERLNIDKLQSASQSLHYRNIVLVCLIFRKSSVLRNDEYWVDVHDENVSALRVTNFSYFESITADNQLVRVSVEFNCFASDKIWTMNDEAVMKVAMKDLIGMNYVDDAPLLFKIVRFDKAYPLYRNGYLEHVECVQKEINKISGLYLAGRNALFRWNSMDDSVNSGVNAAQEVLINRKRDSSVE